MINEVQKAGARLKRVIKEVHYARVAYTEAMIVYQQEQMKPIENSNRLWEDVVRKKRKKAKDVKPAKDALAICGEDTPADANSQALSASSASSRPSKASTPMAKFRNAE